MAPRTRRPTLRPPRVLRARGRVRKMDGSPPAHRLRSSGTEGLGHRDCEPAPDFRPDADVQYAGAVPAAGDRIGQATDISALGVMRRRRRFRSAARQAVLEEYAAKDERIKFSAAESARRHRGRIQRRWPWPPAITSPFWITTTSWPSTHSSGWPGRSSTTGHADMLYSDEDKLQPDGKRLRPFFKPDWSPEFFLGCMYTCHLGVYRTKLLREIGGFRPEFDGRRIMISCSGWSKRRTRSFTFRTCSITGGSCPIRRRRASPPNRTPTPPA